MTFSLPTVQEEVVGWSEAPMGICSLARQDFLPHHDFCGTRDLRETWKEETLVLAGALQCCVGRLWAPPRVLCSMVRDLQRCRKPLMHLEGDDILEASLLEAANNKPGALLTLAEEAALLGKESTPRGSGDCHLPS